MLTKSDVMKFAWELAYDGVKKFGGKASDYIREALKIAWENYRRRKSIVESETAYLNRFRAYPVDAVLPTLQGSEKQVKWANDIRDTLITNVKYKIDHIVDTNNLTDDQAEKGAEMFNSVVRWAVENRLHAKYWIDLYHAGETMAMLAKIKADMTKQNIA